jgi:hypothetical protein
MTAALRPFRGGAQTGIDSFRLIVIVLGIVLMVALARYFLVLRRRAFRSETRTGRSLLSLALAAFAVSSIFTEIGRLGHPITWRLPFNLLGSVLGLSGIFMVLRMGSGQRE